MLAGELGQMCTPREGRRPLAGVIWAGDNGLYGKGYPGDGAWLAWLWRLRPYAERCAFVTAPDVFCSATGRGDAGATLDRSAPWLPVIQALGYPAALVAQDGLEQCAIPWDTFDVLFVGGSTRWKLSAASERIAAEARSRGKPVHMGRVNSQIRWDVAWLFGCATSDGTCIAIAPDTNLDRARTWWSRQPDPQQVHRYLTRVRSRAAGSP